MAKLFSFLLIYATFIAIIKADGLSDISNNLASDLGPLLSLFGDQITRQYLSESIGFLDYFIFAMAPIGIIGTITAVIRVCGSSSLRAFIGRAQEGQGTTEAELCTSTSADVCELFNKGGITRVLGRPDIIELIYIPDRGQANQNQQQGQQISRPRLQLFTSYLEDSSNECWHRMMSSGNGNAVFNKIGRSNFGNSLDLAPKPNLSLNVGIRRQPDWAFFVIALVGFLLQAGILVFAGTAVWLLKWNLQKPNSEASRNYAPGIFIAGTIILCLGAWSCAALIGQTTNEQHYRRSPESSDVLYWIQPGPQVIGDQSFGSFAYSDAKNKDRLMTWTSSTKDFDKNFEPVTYIAVSLVLFGYIAQFIGLRGLNAWISIAQLGITILMSILRGILRMKRLDKSNNRLDIWQDLVTGHELDWLAFDIAEQELAKKSKNNSQDTSVEKYHSKTIENGFLWYRTGQYEEAVRLNNVTMNGSGLEALNTCYKDGESSNSHEGHPPKSYSAEWLVAYNNELIQNRTLLSNLTGHFEESMDAKSYLSWKDERLKPPSGPDRINWSVSSSQIEAILGLWLWSVVRREYDLYGKKNGGSDISSLPNKILNSKIFKVVSACSGKQEWDDSLDTDMSLWLGSGDSKYVKQSLDVRLYNSYKYSLADYWILSDEKPVISGQDTNQTSEEDNESQSYQKVGDSSNDSTAGFQRFCGWNLIYDALSTDTSEEEHNDTPARKRVNVKGYLVKDTEHSLLDICAQELFVALLHSMKALEFRKLDKISVSESGGNFHLENPIISALAKCFTDNGLGTHSDAISCLIPSLRSEIPRYQEKMLSALTPVASNYRRDDEWSSAEVVLSWACQYHHKLNPTDTDETSDFMVALRELGELYRWSLAQMQHSVRQEFGARGIKQMASNFGTANPIVALYSTVTKEIGCKGIKGQEWMDWFHYAVHERRRADALCYLCFAGNIVPHKLSKCLPLAARNGWEEIVSALLEMKLSPNIKDDDGRTAASHCAGSGLWRSLRRLVDMNADLDLADKYNMTPLAYAAMNGHEDVVRLLIKTGQVDLKGSDDCEERSPLWLATYQDHFGIIAELIDKGADVNMRNYRGDGLIDLAFRKGHPRVIKLLLNCRHIYWEPLYVAHVLDQLSERGNRITELELSEIRIDPWIWAAWRGHTDVLRLLFNDSSRLIRPSHDGLRDAKILLARGATLQPLRNHSDGLFSTLDIPPLPSAPITDMHHIKFHPPYSEAPRIMIGISGLSLEQDSPLDMHWEASSVSPTGFTLIRRRHDHRREHADSAYVTWVEFGAEEEELQVGNFPSSENFKDGDVSGTLSEHISFQNAFNGFYEVVVWLHGLSLVHRDDKKLEVSARPNKMTANGFNVDINVSRGAFRSSGRASISWLAYSTYSRHIQSGSFRVGSSDYNIVQRQEFPGTRGRPGFRFKRTPRVFLAFSSLAFIGNEKENIRIKVLLIDREGFDWTCLNPETTPGTVRSGGSAEIQWVAFG